MDLRYLVTSVLGSEIVGELELSDVSFNDPCFGTGGMFSAYAEINQTQDRDRLSALTTPDSVALYVRDDDTGNYLFGGPIFDRPWNRDSRKLQIRAQSWKSWTYQKMLTMNHIDNPVLDVSYLCKM